MLEEAAMMLGRDIAPGSTPAARSIGTGRRWTLWSAGRRALGMGRARGTPGVCGGGAARDGAFAKRRFTWFGGEREGLYTWLDASKGTRAS